MRKDVDVLTLCQKNGGFFPRVILWEDGRSFLIDEIKGIEQKQPWNKVTYTCLVAGKVIHLYLESPNRFYVETTADAGKMAMAE